jgi:UDP-glucose 4-epimerase
MPEGLTVAVTGPTGDIGRALLRALDRRREVARVLGMARRPFDPARMGVRKTEYRRGDVLDRDAVDALAAEAEVVVHLAFIILGGREETRRINLEGSRNVFAAAAAQASVRRIVYTSSVAAYGFHDDNPQPLTEDVHPRGSERFYYSRQKAELEQALEDELASTDTSAFVLRPCVVAGEDALTFVRQLPQARVPGPLRLALLPDPGVRFQLVHHDDVASALSAAVRGVGEPGAYNLAGDGTITLGDVAHELGWRSIPVPRIGLGLAERAAQLPLVPAQVQWIVAARVPVVMDTSRARRELRWRPRHDTLNTLRATVAAAREQGLV